MIKFSTGSRVIEWQDEWVDVSTEFFEAARQSKKIILPLSSSSSVVQWEPAINPVHFINRPHDNDSSTVERALVSLQPIITRVSVTGSPPKVSSDQYYQAFQSLVMQHIDHVESQLLFGTSIDGDPIDGLWDQMIWHHVPVYSVTTAEFFEDVPHKPGVYLGSEYVLNRYHSTSSDTSFFHPVAAFRSYPHRMLRIQGHPVRGFVHTPRLDLQESTWFTVQQNFFTLEFGMMTQCAVWLEDIAGIEGFEFRDLRDVPIPEAKSYHAIL